MGKPKHCSAHIAIDEFTLADLEIEYDSHCCGTVPQSSGTPCRCLPSELAIELGGNVLRDLCRAVSVEQKTPHAGGVLGMLGQRR